MKYNKLIVALLATSVLTACGTKEEAVEEQPVEQQEEQQTINVSAEAESFKQFTKEQMADFVADTELLAKYVNEGNVEGAQKLFPLVTMYYERMQPLTANFGELDQAINGAVEEGKEEEATGFNRLAQGLFTLKNSSGFDVVVDQLVTDVKTLEQELNSLDVSQNNVLASAVLMLEQTTQHLAKTSPANNEVYAVKAQNEAVQKIIGIFTSRVEPETAKTATEKAAILDEAVAYYEVGKEDYVNYSFFTNKQKEELTKAVTDVKDALQQMNDTLK
ncbi:EfeM/EfeO family lipoprotein [Solibacillus sp.]|uniref:EfeM/EfeO family lipoprotein n=1 Tax=Solibacillus sp. TaxID=1909654 RepID=UPI003314ED57